MSTEDLLLDISLQKEFVDAGIVPPILHTTSRNCEALSSRRTEACESEVQEGLEFSMCNNLRYYNIRQFDWDKNFGTAEASSLEEGRPFYSDLLLPDNRHARGFVVYNPKTNVSKCFKLIEAKRDWDEDVVSWSFESTDDGGALTIVVYNE